jgi:outer membrane protein assembly factor BamB
LHDPKTGTQKDAVPRWQQKQLSRIYGVAVTPNALLLSGVVDAIKDGEKPTAQVLALSIKDGAVLWSRPLPAAPVSWGMLVDRDGRVVVSLQDGKVVCLGAAK